MKKSILFISSNMKVGGFQKSLLSVLSYFDYAAYHVDLLLFSPVGVFMELIPPEVNLLPVNMPASYFETFPRCLQELISKGQWQLAAKRVFQACVAQKDKGYGGMVMASAIPALKKEYDAVIDYNGQYILYYMIDKIKAKKKITYFHSDYKKWPYYYNADKKYLEKADYIVTVSSECKKSLDEVFPNCLHKTRVIENIISHKTVNLYPKDSNDFTDYDFKGLRIVTVGRVCREKGIDLAIKACARLKQDGYNIRWYAVGPLSDKKSLDALVKINDVEDCFIFLGETMNPYDYMRNADIIVHPSRFEGKAVAVEEAKLLDKAIVVTNFSTVHDQIQNGKNGLIVDMSAQAVYQGVKKLINDPVLRRNFAATLQNEASGNEKEIEKLYKLIER